MTYFPQLALTHTLTRHTDKHSSPLLNYILMHSAQQGGSVMKGREDEDEEEEG